MPWEADGGATITVWVKAIRSGYVSATKTSAPTAIAKLLTGTTPTVTGTKAVGSTLTANAGAWSPAPVTLAYQWYRGTTAIAGATGTTYALTAADQGLQIRVKVTGTKSGYAALSKYSAYTVAIA